LSIIDKLETFCQEEALHQCNGNRSKAANILYATPGQPLANPAARFTQRESHLVNVRNKQT
ncbi:MAG: hypothetical protein WCP31_04425, partial [Chloroflexales bacterium]